MTTLLEVKNYEFTLIKANIMPNIFTIKYNELRYIVFLYRKFFSSYKKFLKIKHGTKISDISFYKRFDTCVVLGNGPSLKEDINNINHIGNDFVVVNHFSESEKFNLYKPTKYVIIDTYFWDANSHKSHKTNTNQ